MRRYFGACLEKVRDPVRRFGALGTSERVLFAASALVLVIGLFYRLKGQIGSHEGFWLDEALWAKRVLLNPITSHSIRPIAFMWVTKQLVSAFGPTEFWFRFLSNAASVAGLLLAPYVASRLVKSKVARFTLVAAYALHPALIDLAKEFKPYSMEAFVHLGLLALYLRYRETERARYFYALLVLLPLSFLFAYNVVFAYPGLLLLAVGDAHRRWGKRGALLPVGTGAACLALAAASYVFLMRDISTDKTEQYWGKKYDVFWLPKAQKPGSARHASALLPARGGDDKEAGGAAGDDSDADKRSSMVRGDTDVADHGEAGRELPDSAEGSRLAWMAEKYGDVAALPGIRRDLWRLPSFAPAILPRLDYWFWIALHALGLGVLAVRRRHAHLLLLVLPLALVVTANVVGFWPMGAFRTNLFLIVYSIGIAATGVDEVAKGSALRPVAVGALLLLLHALPSLAFGFDWHGRKQTWTRGFPVLELLTELKQQRLQQLQLDPNRKPALILRDLGTYVPLNYYLEHHPAARSEYKAFFETNFRQKKVRGARTRLPSELRRRLRGKAQPLWVVVSRDLDAVEDILKQEAKVLTMTRYTDGSLIALVAPKAYQRTW